jgi:phosphinothricin acetyltransferase
MEYEIRPVNEKDRLGVTAVFNHFVENSFAAFPEEKVDSSFFDRMVAVSKGYPFYVIEVDGGKLAGFALLHPYHRSPTISRTAEVTYFILPEHTGRGLGGRILDRFIKDAREMGIDNLLASISSLNEGSISFHAQHGFVECGRFRRIGRKRGRDFDIVWMQKFL